MVKRIYESLMFSLEWRLYAFVITSLFLWATTGELVFAAVQALGLQVILLIGHTTWYYFRKEGASGFTLERVTTKIASFILRSLGSRGL